jgi:hypothetical protein
MVSGCVGGHYGGVIGGGKAVTKLVSVVVEDIKDVVAVVV